jgi:alpha-galactosidase
MLHFRQAKIRVNGKEHLIQPDRTNSFDSFYVDFRSETDMNDGTRWTVYLHPKTDIKVDKVELIWEVTDAALADGFFLANGYQSWSESRLLSVRDRLPRLHWIARAAMGLYGDEHIQKIPRGRGHLHAWTWTTLKSDPSDNHVLFAGSANESTGHTLWMYDARNRLLTARKDLREGGLHLGHSFQAMDVWTEHGLEHLMYKRYFGEIQEVANPNTIQKPDGLGWTSWYRHFTNISEAALLQDLEGVAESGLHFKYFQIDDGWQTHVGDWRSVKPEFPKGMGHLVDQIRERGLRPGLWLAPFVVSKHSDTYKKHPEWLLRGKNSKPIRVGWNPMWGGWYYALDFYNPEVRDYLSGVFHVATQKWGYELFKLDFLFAVCLAPPKGKTRGQVMHEAMQFLRDLVGSRQILACGAPLGASFGLVDAMRIGGDIHLKWKHGLLTWLRHRERVDTLASLRSTLHRYQLDGKVWANDPDVFILRTEKQHLTHTQQHTVLIINALLGTLLFTSDDVSQYTPEQTSELESALKWRGAEVQQVAELGEDLYRVTFQRNQKHYVAYANLSAKAVYLPNKYQLFAYETEIFEESSL